MSRRGIFRAITLFVVLLIATVIALNLWSPSWWRRLIYPLAYEREIARHARLNRLDPHLVAAVIYVESGFDADSESRAGARGLMQLLPDTAREASERLGERDFDGATLTDPETNIRYGTWYLRHLIDRYDSATFALAAYNGGGTNMDRWLKGKQNLSEQQVVASIPFRETREFVARVRKTEGIYRQLYPDVFK